MQTITLNEQTIGLKNYYFVRFKFDREIYKRFRELDGCHWDKQEHCWVVDRSFLDQQELEEHFNDLAEIRIIHERLESVEYRKERLKPIDFLQPLAPEFEDAIKAFSSYLRSMRYSPRTIDVYCDSLKTFIRFLQPEDLKEVSEQDLIRFNNDYILAHEFSASYQNQVVNAVKLFYGAIFHHKMDLDLVHRPRREKLLPNVLSKEEVKKILESTRNMKHRAMLSLIYACGLRRSELLHLRPVDVDSKRKVLIIRQAKGKKDRIVPISEKIILLLRDYYKAYRPKKWLFEGQFGEEQYSATSLQKVLKQSVNQAKINKPVTLHWLRHSYATHLLESGTDLRYIQEILGHKSSKTTEIYTHVSTQAIQKIRSPFDDL